MKRSHAASAAVASGYACATLAYTHTEEPSFREFHLEATNDDGSMMCDAGVTAGRVVGVGSAGSISILRPPAADRGIVLGALVQGYKVTVDADGRLCVVELAGAPTVRCGECRRTD